MRDNKSDNSRLADPFETDELSEHRFVAGQIGSGITHPKDAGESDGGSPDRKEEESSQ